MKTVTVLFKVGFYFVCHCTL